MANTDKVSIKKSLLELDSLITFIFDYLETEGRKRP